MSDRNVFIYWTGNEPSLIRLLRKIMLLHSRNGENYNLVFINDNNIDNFIKKPSYFNLLHPAHKADFLRVQVLTEHGGIWLDSDTLVMNDLSKLFEIIEKKDGFFIMENNQILWNGVFGTKKNSPLMLHWKSKLEETLDKKKQFIQWSEVGCLMLDQISKNTNLFNNYEIFQGLDSVYPANWDRCVREFLNKPYDNYKNLQRENQPFIVLVNSVYKSLSSFSEDEILNGNFPLSYFLQKSIKECKKE
jgi:hypothetical protein